MIERVFDIIPMQNIVFFMMIYGLFGAYYRSKFESAVNDELTKLNDMVNDLTIELSDIKQMSEGLEAALQTLVYDLTPDDVKIQRLIDQGFPEDIALEAVVCGEVWGFKIK